MNHIDPDLMILLIIIGITDLGILITLYGTFFYKRSGPLLVFSCDHGHFFPPGPKWNAQSLAAAASAKIDGSFSANCAFIDEEIHKALRALRAVNEDNIHCSVLVPPAGFTHDLHFTRNGPLVATVWLKMRYIRYMADRLLLAKWSSADSLHLN